MTEQGAPAWELTAGPAPGAPGRTEGGHTPRAGHMVHLKC